MLIKSDCRWRARVDGTCTAETVSGSRASAVIEALPLLYRWRGKTSQGCYARKNSGRTARTTTRYFQRTMISRMGCVASAVSCRCVLQLIKRQQPRCRFSFSIKTCNLNCLRAFCLDRARFNDGIGGPMPPPIFLHTILLFFAYFFFRPARQIAND